MQEQHFIPRFVLKSYRDIKGNFRILDNGVIKTPRKDKFCYYDKWDDKTENFFGKNIENKLSKIKKSKSPNNDIWDISAILPILMERIIHPDTSQSTVSSIIEETNRLGKDILNDQLIKRNNYKIFTFKSDKRFCCSCLWFTSLPIYKSFILTVDSSFAIVFLNMDSCFSEDFSSILNQNLLSRFLVGTGNLPVLLSSKITTDEKVLLEIQNNNKNIYDEFDKLEQINSKIITELKL